MLKRSARKTEKPKWLFGVGDAAVPQDQVEHAPRVKEQAEEMLRVNMIN